MKDVPTATITNLVPHGSTIEYDVTITDPDDAMTSNIQPNAYNQQTGGITKGSTASINTSGSSTYHVVTSALAVDTQY